MLDENDLERFQELFNSALELPDDFVENDISAILQVDSEGFSTHEIFKLNRSIQIAFFAGELSEELFFVADIISRSLKKNVIYSRFEASATWVLAMRVAMKSMYSKQFPKPRLMQREQEVGEACLRLKNAGYKISMNAFGPWPDDQVRTNVSRTIRNLIGLLGGQEVITKLCGDMMRSGRYHDEMWLFGQFNLGVTQNAEPDIPFGWLFSLAMGQLGKKAQARKPDVAWNTILRLSTDLATSFNSQRYNQFDGIDLDPSQLIDCFKESLVRREVFSVPQVPKIAVSYFKRVFSRESIWPKGTSEAAKNITLLFEEFESLLECSFGDQPCKLDNRSAKDRFPIIWKIGRAQVRNINKLYRDPLINEHKNHTSFIFFEINNLHSIILPRSWMTEAFLTIVFTQIRKNLIAEDADKFTGDVFEAVVEEACKDKRGETKPNFKYELQHEKKGERERQIDVLHRDENEIHIFEIKSKSLTKKARNLDFQCYLDDFKSSYLSLLYQTVRHDYCICNGQLPFIGENQTQKTNSYRTTKICVSPLSYGAICDNLLINQIIRAFNSCEISFENGNEKTAKAFNKQIEKIFSEIRKFEKIKNSNDLFEYFLDVWWFDIGQLLYVLDRAYSVDEAFCPLSNITTTSRDFWTEVACADRDHRTSGKWKPITAKLNK